MFYCMVMASLQRSNTMQKSNQKKLKRVSTLEVKSEKMLMRKLRLMLEKTVGTVKKMVVWSAFRKQEDDRKRRGFGRDSLLLLLLLHC